MQQLEIKFFWPLTEQIPLDLDFKPSTDYEDEKRAVRYWANSTALNDDINTNYIIKIGNNHRVGVRPEDTTFTRKFVIDVDTTPIAVTSKEKPNFIKRYIYKILGVQWKAK